MTKYVTLPSVGRTDYSEFAGPFFWANNKKYWFAGEYPAKNIIFGRYHTGSAMGRVFVTRFGTDILLQGSKNTSATVYDGTGHEDRSDGWWIYNSEYNVYVYPHYDVQEWIAPWDTELKDYSSVEEFLAEVIPLWDSNKYALPVQWSSPYRTAPYETSFDIYVVKNSTTMSVSPSSVTLSLSSGTAATVSVSTNSDGTLSATSADTSIATVTAGSRSLSILPGSTAGTTTITATLSSSSTYAAASASVSVTVEA